ncbi:death-associated protein kinase 2-like [Limulus polyphemus]|uniref:Death-associated protein kinase 2-like n=1 Tax=Limulus polyphemus TaxID=6850 RepID=A0ABM1BPA7_LIMPO|nr:death-associated protein kinase 2-like [Limulus polyphemus]
MWSLGILTYVLLSGHTPFGGETKQETFCNITSSPLEFPDQMFLEVSNHAKEFIRRLLVRNPRERMSSVECFQHPWVYTKSKEIQESTFTSSVEKMGGDSVHDLNMNYTAKLSSPVFTQQDLHQT